MQSTSALRIYPKGQRKEISKNAYYDNIKAFVSTYVEGKLPLFYTPRTSGLSDVANILMKKVTEVGQRALVDPETREIIFESETAVTSPTTYILRSGDFLYSLSTLEIPNFANFASGFYVLEFDDGTNYFESEIYHYSPVLTGNNFIYSDGSRDTLIYSDDSTDLIIWK
jgi:hypothetical protein